MAAESTGDDTTGQDIPNLPLLDAAVPRPEDLKPAWRGWIHAGAFPVTIAAGTVLLTLADGRAAKWSSLVFVLSSLLLFGNSALYHRFNWRPRTKLVLRRIDHANIFLLIAGSYTPITVLALSPAKSVLLLSLIWGGALLGIAFQVFWITAPRWLYVPLYLALGWGSLLFIVDFFQANAAMMTLIVVAGLCYSVGAVIYGLKKPNPVPGVFGFHEIFHSLTVVAFLCQWVAILIIATHPLYP